MNNGIAKATSGSLAAALTFLRTQREELEKKINDIDTALRLLGSFAPEAEQRPAPFVVVTASNGIDHSSTRQVIDEAPAAEKIAKQTLTRKTRGLPKVTDKERRMIVGVIRSAGRFMYSEQLPAELVRVGVDYGSELAGYLKELVRDGTLARVRYGASNRCVAYGLPSYLGVEDGEHFVDARHHATGKNIDGVDITIELATPGE